MSMFSKVFKNQRKLREEAVAKREEQCSRDITAALKTHGCAIEPYLDYGTHQIRAQARIVALPEKPEWPKNQATNEDTTTKEPSNEGQESGGTQNG